VELGPGGRNIGPVAKDKIESLKLPGIMFSEGYKRYYPSGDYASYTIGATRKHEDGDIEGVLGIEMYYDSILTGTNGYREYQKDLYGIKIPNTYERQVDPVDGSDIYLTIDTNIQWFVEQAAKEVDKKSNPEWFVMIIADAKTGAILGTTSTPSFDPNNLGTIENWLNPVMSYPYEPGSTMKIYSYLTAIEKGTYDGNATVLSGQLKVGKDVINDWNDVGWGKITFDYGFAQSSNVAASSLLLDGYITVDDLREMYQKLGFGEKTGIHLPRESTGKVEIRSDKISQLNATFGQGITTTAIQNVQALTVLSNNGIMLKPYIVDKIVDANGNITYQGSREEMGHIVRPETVAKMKELMYSVVHNDWQNGTGYMYKIKDFDIIGKTGTAQIADTVYGGYLTGPNDYVKSFAGMFPKDNPEIIIYSAIKKGSLSNTHMSNAVKEVIRNTAKHLNIFKEENEDSTSNAYTISSYVNKYVSNVSKELKDHNIEPILLGSGDKIINQYPKMDTHVLSNEKIFLVTNKKDIILPNFIGWSKKDVLAYCNLIDLPCEIEGSGYVTSQSHPKGTEIDEKLSSKVTLATKEK